MQYWGDAVVRISTPIGHTDKLGATDEAQRASNEGRRRMQIVAIWGSNLTEKVLKTGGNQKQS